MRLSLPHQMTLRAVLADGDAQGRFSTSSSTTQANITSSVTITGLAVIAGHQGIEHPE